MNINVQHTFPVSGRKCRQPNEGWHIADDLEWPLNNIYNVRSQLRRSSEMLNPPMLSLITTITKVGHHVSNYFYYRP